MLPTVRVAAACVPALIALLVFSASSAAAPKRITGELSRSGYTVIALAESGEAKLVRATPDFKLRPPNKRVSLHLQGRDGVYAGPIVVGTEKNGRRAIVGVKRGARLGEVVVKPRKGYAKSKGVDPSKVDAKRDARARKGVPIGAGNFGLVRSRSLRPASPGDRDADGIADPLDIDANGNGIVDRYEGRTVATTAAEFTDIYVMVIGINDDETVQARLCGSTDEIRVRWPQSEPEPIVGQAYVGDADTGPDAAIASNVRGPLGDECPASANLPTLTPTISLTLRETVNANAPATLATLDQTFAERARFLILGQTNLKVELNCGGAPIEGNPNGWSGGLRYCRRGGTGRANDYILPSTPPSSWPFEFPACCDDDGDGFGDIRPLLTDPNNLGALYAPGVTTADIGTGDILTWLVTEGGEVTPLPRALPDVFATVPALTAYDDDGPTGNPPSPVSYPVPSPYVGSPPTPEESNFGSHVGFPVAPCPQNSEPPCVPGEVVVTMTFWRPQREAIGDEPGPWTDVGGLVYAPAIGGLGFPPTPNCMPADLSEDDPLLTLAKSPAQYGPGFGFRDAAGDRQADPQQTFTFSINMTECFGGTWEQGEKAKMSLVGSILSAKTAGYSATQTLLFTRE